MNTQKLAVTDPVAFINNIDKPAIIDEIQKVPELLSQIQVKVDELNKPGQFIVIGSESLLLSEKISQSLAGRVVNNILLPLSYEELKANNKELKNTNEQILTGFYPRVYDSVMSHSDFYPEYVNTYVQKDVRQLQNIGDLSLFEKFLLLMAGRVGQLVNLVSLSNDVGVSHNTIEQWISLLEASFVVFRLKPYYKNLGKRVTKSPKIYFHDVGLLCYLLGINSPSELLNHYAYGSIFENLVISETKKHIYNNKLNSKVYFYKDSNQSEIDLLIEMGSQIQGVEIKSAQTYNSDFVKGLKVFPEIPNTSFVGSVVYQGDLEQPVEGFSLYNFKGLDKLLDKIV